MGPYCFQFFQFPQYQLLRLLFLPPQSPQPQDHKVRGKKNERLSLILFLLIYYYFSALSIDFVFDAIFRLLVIVLLTPTEIILKLCNLS